MRTAAHYQLLGTFPLLCLAAACVSAPDYTTPPTIAAIEQAGEYSAQNTLSGERTALSNWWSAIGKSELESMVERLKTDSLELAQVRARILQTRARAKQSKGARLPTLRGGTDLSYSRSRTSPASDLNWSDRYSLDFLLGWDADIFGGLRSAQRASTLTAAAAELAYQDSERKQIAILARNWLAAATLKRRITQSEVIAESFKQTFEVTDQRYRSGSIQVSAADVQISKQNYESALAETPGLISQLQVQLNAIDIQLGRLPSQTYSDFVGELEIDINAALPFGLPAHLLRQRPDVAAAELRYRAALQDVGTARSNLYPNLFLSSSLVFQGVNPGDVFKVEDYISGLVSSLIAPIYQGGRLRQEVRVQTAAADEFAASFALTALGAVADVEDALARLEGSRLQITQLRKAVQSAELANRLAQERYRTGLESLLKVLETQRSLNAVTLKLIIAEQEFLNAKIDLYLGIGSDWASLEGERQEVDSSDE